MMYKQALIAMSKLFAFFVAVASIVIILVMLSSGDGGSSQEVYEQCRTLLEYSEFLECMKGGQ